MKTKIITEGKTKLIVPDFEGIPEEGAVFYNPKMALNRSRSALILNSACEKKAKVADVLSGLGARAVRYANEGNDFEVHANDIQPSAVKLCAESAELNKVKVSTSVMEANQFLMQNKYNKFDFIDIDPFGSPMPFINSALHAINPVGGTLGITATDAGTLAGVYPKACFRRYFSVSGRTTFQHELGLRNLIASVFREASKFEYSVKPLYSYNHIHYNRAFIQVNGGRKAANRELKSIGYIKYCKKCERREMIPVFKEYDFKCECGSDAKLYGLTWIGKIADLVFLDSMHRKNRQECFENKIPDGDSEYSIDVPYYSVSALTSVHKKESIKLQDIIEALRNKGYKAFKTHFEGQAFKTNAPYEEIIKSMLRK